MIRLLGVSTLVVLLAAVPAFAQRPGGPAPAAQPPAAPAPAPAPLAPVPAPSLVSAQKMLAAAAAKATEMGTTVACVVVDVHGDLVAGMRMDGVRFLIFDVAWGKARASAFYGLASADLAQRSALLESVGEAIGKPIMPSRGAVPVVRQNLRVGAIGCSGGTGEQDENSAKAGLAAGQ